MKESGAIIKELISLVDKWEPVLKGLPVENTKRPCNSQSRSIKQILGHMIDSVSNNTHRIIHLQYQPGPLIFPNYATLGNNDRWISVQNYQNEDWMVLIQLWKYSILHICHVIENVNDDRLNNEWIAGPEHKVTLKTMIIDFPVHMRLHLSEIKELIDK